MAQAGRTTQEILERPELPCACVVCEVATACEGHVPQPLQGPLPRVAAFELGCAPLQSLDETLAALCAVPEVRPPARSAVFMHCAHTPE